MDIERIYTDGYEAREKERDYDPMGSGAVYDAMTELAALRKELADLKQSIPELKADAVRDMLKCVLRVSDGFSHDLIGRIREHADRTGAGV